MTTLQSCETGRIAFRCPTKWELWHQLLALLPHGRAWQTHEAPVYTADEAGDPTIDSLSTQGRYWAAFATVLEYMHARACALLEEMFCDTASEMRPEWWTEWGFPDPCEPYETVCEKMRDVGGARCADIVALAASRGWAVECRDCDGHTTATADCAPAGCAVDNPCPPNTLFIRILIADSPAYVAPTTPLAVADCAIADCNTPCSEPDTSLLRCLIERVRHAHVRVVYEVVTCSFDDEFTEEFC